MDKRIFLGTRTYKRPDGSTFSAQIFLKKSVSARRITSRMVYGQFEIYLPGAVSEKRLDAFVTEIEKKYPDHILDRPFMKEGIYIYQLGEKRLFTHDAAFRNDPRFFYTSRTTKDPITVYKKAFLSYLIPRVIEIGRRMGVDLRGWKIRTGLFVTYYGVCFPTKQQLKFDYRLFAYKPEISDAIIYHEIAHIFDIHHDRNFYDIVRRYCPDYDEREDDIRCGRFEGGRDRYVLQGH